MIDWTYIQNNWDWAGHIVEALCIAAVVALLARITHAWRVAFIIGLSFAMGHFHGREKRDFELSANIKPPHVEAYNFFEWSWDQATDFWPTALVCSALIFLITRKKD